MIILKEQITAQTINFIPRSYDANTLVLTNETTNEVQTIVAEFYKNDYFLQCSTIFDLKQNNFYILEVKYNTDVIYKDKIFCTNQNTNVFSVNADKYVSHATTNEYIVYE